MPNATPRKSKVCFLLPSHWSAAMGGAEFQARELLRVMHATGKYEIYVLTRLFDSTVIDESHRVIASGGPRIFWKYGQFFDARQILKQLAVIKPDIIYHRVGCAYTGIAAYYAKHNQCRLVWHVASTADVTPGTFRLASIIRQPHHFIEKKILEYGVRNINNVVVQTEDQQSLLKVHYGKESAQLIRNFVEVPELASKSETPVKILWIGNLKPLKQPEIFVELAEKIGFPGNIELSMIGSAFADRALQEKFERSIKAVDGLRYLGLLDQEEVNRELANTHLLVNTSVYEGFSNTFIQAWMQCVPVVSLNVNPDQLLDDSFLGVVSGGVNDLVKDVQSLCANRELRTAMGRKARRYAIEHFSMRNAQRLEDYLASKDSANQVND